MNESEGLKPYKPGRPRCCGYDSSSDDDRDRNFFHRWNLQHIHGKNVLVRIPNTKFHPLPPDLGVDPVVVDPTKTILAPRKPYRNPKREKQYQEALLKSWERTHVLLGMDPSTPPPTSDKAHDPVRDGEYAKVAAFTGVHYIKNARFFFVVPCREIENLQHYFPSIVDPALEIVDDAGRRQMFVAETLKMLRRTTRRNGDGCFMRAFRKLTMRPINRNIQPWEASFFGPDGKGVMHASRSNSHDITITDFYNEICYIIRTDTGRFPRHYNIIDAKTKIILCQLSVPLPPEDEVLGNFDVLLEENRIGKIRQGSWSFAMESNRNPYRMRHGVYLHADLNPELKAFIIVAVVNAHFTFNVTKEVEDIKNNDVERCNPDIWYSVFPYKDISDPYRHDIYYLDHAVYQYRPWYIEPAGTKRLSSGSIEFKGDEFLINHMERTIDFNYDLAKGNDIGLPYRKPMPHSERLKRNLYWVTNNDVPIMNEEEDYDVDSIVVKFTPEEVKKITQREKKNDSKINKKD